MSEMRQYNLKYVTNINLRNYLRIISGKTAALFAISFYIGAKESNCDEKLSKTLGKIGYNVGMAFQIIDDILDYCGDVDVLGKNSLNDLKKGYYTLPLLYALENDSKKEIQKILESNSFSDKDIDKLVKLVKEYGGIEKANKLANKYTDRAFNYISKLPDITSKQIIEDIVERLLQRKY